MQTKAMCDEYDDEQMAAFWRRLAQLERKEADLSATETDAEPLVRIEPVAPERPSAKPRSFSR